MKEVIAVRIGDKWRDSGAQGEARNKRVRKTAATKYVQTDWTRMVMWGRDVSY